MFLTCSALSQGEELYVSGLRLCFGHAKGSRTVVRYGVVWPIRRSTNFPVIRDHAHDLNKSLGVAGRNNSASKIEEHQNPVVSFNEVQSPKIWSNQGSLG